MKLRVNISENFKNKTKNREKFKLKINKRKIKIDSYSIIKSALLTTIVITIITTPLGTMAFGRHLNDIEVEQNAIIYEKQIESYDIKVEKYAKEIRNLDLTDLQIIMKVMKDMWQEIDGYGWPNNKYRGYRRLSLQEENMGVCSNFADDMAYKLNKINPDFKAKSICVNLKENEYFDIANIERKILQQHLANQEKNISQENFQNNIIKSLKGNHVVCEITIPNEIYKLIIDPTNPSIGVMQNGKIYILNAKRDDLMKFINHESYIHYNESFSEFITEFFNSFKKFEVPIDELDEIYGLEAQNEALDYIDSLEKESNKSKNND